ncbi:hypothetical protein OFO01_07040 [Campylobacter sp. JMF_01 NE2]|uniref:hypothetical protein n=1 Tax=unclassified Campylobacter TaxID=2593542 RepID=UPI0022E99C8D|nr:MULTISPECIES: hypothetical protein [unclassified Campylobacter]MDA3053282.1 hypothetical protein [Campylobacter sp. JMF_03 NE3]MDA3067535.1 hypothetical protein [Campylobacter sp. JMF_01 NE2]
MKKMSLFALFCIVFAGCADKTKVTYNEVKQQSCTALNLISVFATKPNVREIRDMRRQDQKTYENTLFNTKEYCRMQNMDISSIINDYEIRTTYSNSISFKDGIVTLSPSGKTYVALENSFNFMAIDKEHNVKVFKNAEKVKFKDKYLMLEILRDYADAQTPFTIGMTVYGEENQILEQTIFSLNNKKNMFIYDDYVITF